MTEEELNEAIQEGIESGLIVEAGVNETGEQLYKLTDLGKRIVQTTLAKGDASLN